MLDISIKEAENEKWLLEVREKEHGRRIRLKVNSDYNRVKLVAYCLKFIDEHPEYREFIRSNEEMTKARLRNALAAELKTNDFTIIDDALPIVEKVHLKLQEEEDKVDPINVLEKVQIPENALRVLLRGRFGVGKSTLIKACCNFPLNLDFPVTDTGRTTTYSTEYVFKANNHTSKYGFAVAFLSKNKQKMKLEDALIRSIVKLIQSTLKKTGDLDTEDEVMKSFVTDPARLFKVEYLFGKYYPTHHPKRFDEARSEQVNWWEALYKRIQKLVGHLFEEEGLNDKVIFDSTDDWSKIEGLEEKLVAHTKREGTESFLQYETIIRELIDRIQDKAETICTVLELGGLGVPITDSSGSISGFYANNYTESNVEQLVTPFTSTQNQRFGHLLTPVVDRIRIEVPYNDAFSPKIRRSSIVITDTVGVEHAKNTDTRSIEGSTNFLFEQYDFITVVDDASKSMDTTTTNILRNLFSTADKSKIFLTYTFYDKFDKKDLEDDEDKDFELFTLQETAFRKIAEEISYDNIDWFIQDFKDRTVILKDLSPTTQEFTSVANYLEKMIDYRNELSDFKRIYRTNLDWPILRYNFKKLALVFSHAQREYLEQQHKIYLGEYLPYKTAEALTKRLYWGETYFIGINRTLQPVDDFCDGLMTKLQPFLMNPTEENFSHKNINIPNLSEKVKDWFKELVSDEIKKLSKREFVDHYEDHWKRAYFDNGNGSDLRRKKAIMAIFNQILPPLDVQSHNNAEIWIDALERIIMEAIKKMEEQDS